MLCTNILSLVCIQVACIFSCRLDYLPQFVDFEIMYMYKENIGWIAIAGVLIQMFAGTDMFRWLLISLTFAVLFIFFLWSILSVNWYQLPNLEQAWLENKCA